MAGAPPSRPENGGFADHGHCSWCLRLSAFICGFHQAINADTAIRLGVYFGLEPEFWLNLQMPLTPPSRP